MQVLLHGEEVALHHQTHGLREVGGAWPGGDGNMGHMMKKGGNQAKFMELANIHQLERGQVDEHKMPYDSTKKKLSVSGHVPLFQKNTSNEQPTLQKKGCQDMSSPQSSGSKWSLKDHHPTY